ncbi:hypothetical protein BDQ17DRAFT_1432995 [Cyathus striatus]|nr:hypothetical protein BDQ17DRAFT_1432995 [Cyathus striatus]
MNHESSSLKVHHADVGLLGILIANDGDYVVKFVDAFESCTKSWTDSDVHAVRIGSRSPKVGHSMIIYIGTGCHEVQVMKKCGPFISLQPPNSAPVSNSSDVHNSARNYSGPETHISQHATLGSENNGVSNTAQNNENSTLETGELHQITEPVATGAYAIPGHPRGHDDINYGAANAIPHAARHLHVPPIPNKDIGGAFYRPVPTRFRALLEGPPKLDRHQNLNQQAEGHRRMSVLAENRTNDNIYAEIRYPDNRLPPMNVPNVQPNYIPAQRQGAYNNAFLNLNRQPEGRRMHGLTENRENNAYAANHYPDNKLPPMNAPNAQANYVPARPDKEPYHAFFEPGLAPTEPVHYGQEIYATAPAILYNLPQGMKYPPPPRLQKNQNLLRRDGP